MADFSSNLSSGAQAEQGIQEELLTNKEGNVFDFVFEGAEVGETIRAPIAHTFMTKYLEKRERKGKRT